MDVLMRFGFSIEEIKNMMDTNHNLEEVNDRDIYELIDLLKKIGCDDDMIKNIFLCNSFCLSRSINETNHLITKLYELGFSSLAWLLDSNPYLLNLYDEEIDNIYQIKVKEGLSKEEILDYFYHTIIM